VPPELTPSLFTALAESDDLIDQPFERRVTLLLMQGLQVVRGAIERGSAEEILKGVSRGVSANLCEALASMSPGVSRARLQVRMSWSRSRPRIPRGILPEIAFAESDFGVIREAGRRLRESFEPRRERVEGLILGLQAEPAQLFEDFQGKVVLRALVDGRPVRVRVVLDQASYAIACDAHRDGRRVTISGILQRDAQAKQYDLLHPQRFQVLPPESETP